MIRFSTLLTRATAAIMLGSVMLLAGCHMGGTTKGDVITTSSMKGQFDTVIQAYKDGQFLVDGALLSAMDTGGHFAYLKEQGKLPKTILLERSDESKIRKAHLQYMARMQMDYGFTVYYDNKGTLMKINPVETEARPLEDYHAPAKMADPLQDKGASSSGFDPSRGY